MNQLPEIAKRIGRLRAITGFRRIPHTLHGACPRSTPQRNRCLARVRSPDHPVFANVDAIGHENAKEWPALLSSQLTSPVRWKQILHQLSGLGFITRRGKTGSVLTGMAKGLKDLTTISITSPSDVDKLLKQLLVNNPRHQMHLKVNIYLQPNALFVSPCAGIFTPTDKDLTEAKPVFS